MWLEEAGSTLMEEVVGAEGLREEGGEGAEGGVLVGGDEDLDLPGAADLLEELTAVAAGHGGDGEADDAGLASSGGVRHQELLRVNGVVERQTGELKVHADEDSAAGPQSDGADVVAGDRRPRESLGGGDEEWEEVPHGGDARLLGHGLRLRRLNHEPPAHRYRFLLLHLRLVVVSVLLEAWKGASKPRKKKDGNYLTSRFKDSGFDSILGNRVASITQSQWIREQHSRFIGEALSYICNVEPSAGEREEGSITGDRLHALLRRALPPPPAIRLQIEPSPMATATRYWIVSLPVQNSATTLWNRLRESISKNSFDTPLYRFNTPDLRVGTLDSLLALSDDLVKSNAFIEGVTHKIRRQIEELEKASGVEVGALTVDGVPVDSYLTRFVWDEGKYPTMSPLREIVDNIHVQVAKLEDDMKVRVAEYSNIRSQLNAINRKQSGSLAVRDLSNLVNPEDIVTSEHLVTLLAIVPKYSQKDWLSSYETLTTFVVPRSAKKLHEDNEYALYTLTLFRKVVDNFRNNAREKGFQIREFEYSPESQESRKQELEKLMQDQESKRSSLLQWCYASYGEVFVSWMHFCAVRVFAESILRYGLPPSFLSVVLAPFGKSEKKVRSILEALCGNVNSSYWKSEDEVSVPGIAGEGEAYPYVSFTLNLV